MRAFQCFSCTLEAAFALDPRALFNEIAGLEFKDLVKP
jgi:hypothetical protein